LTRRLSRMIVMLGHCVLVFLRTQRSLINGSGHLPAETQAS